MVELIICAATSFVTLAPRTQGEGIELAVHGIFAARRLLGLMHLMPLMPLMTLMTLMHLMHLMPLTLMVENLN